MKRLSVLPAMLSLVWSAANAAPLSPVGVWSTFDDDGQRTGKVELWEQNDLLYGRIVAIDDPTKAHLICLKCTDDRKDAPLLGLQFMRGLHKDGDEWNGGQILDPKTGSIYRCTVRVLDDGRKLQVRGFLGISLFGRSQIWVRAG